MEHNQSNLGLDQCHDCGVRRHQLSNPTSNFLWQMPTATDLVTDLPADFEVFGQAVDTSLADLKGGTSGQILAKNTNADMDFVWITNDVGDITAVTAGTGISGGGTSGAVTVTNSMATAITTAGDLIKGTGSGTFDRLGIGSSGQVLTVTAGAPAWETPASGGKVLQVVSATYSTQVINSTTSYADTGLTATITPSATSSKILCLVTQSGVFKTLGNYNFCYVQLLRGGSSIIEFERLGGYTETNATNGIGAASTAYLDSPATTSATTYKTQFKSEEAGGASVRVQANAGVSTITLLEIGA
jgi:hypothetical protein